MASALDQHLAIVQHQRRHAPQRIEACHLLGIAEGRPGSMLERHAVEPQRDGHAPDERGIVLPDQDHRRSSLAPSSTAQPTSRPVGGKLAASRLRRSRLTLASMWAVIGAVQEQEHADQQLMIGRIAAQQPEVEGRGQQETAGTQGRGLGRRVQALDQARQLGEAQRAHEQEEAAAEDQQRR